LKEKNSLLVLLVDINNYPFEGGRTNMNEKTIVLGATALLLGVITLLPRTALAYRGDTAIQGPNYTQERHDSMTKAFSDKDYNAWKALMNNKGVTNRITAENFAKFAEAHQLSLDGKTAEATQLRTELGLGQQNGSGMGRGNGRGKINH